MELIQGLENIVDKILGGAVALGNFDGVHLAHQEVLKTCKHLALQLNVPAIALTFDPHPREILQAMQNKPVTHRYVASFKEKLELLQAAGMDFILVLNFTPQFASLSALDFIKNILVEQLKVSAVVTGYNFHFGHKCQGNPSVLGEAAVQYGFKYQQINKICYSYHEVSSSYIKQMLNVGAVKIASRILGRQYQICGKVIEQQNNHYIMELNPSLYYPADGLYLIVNKRMDYGFAEIDREEGRMRLSFFDATNPTPANSIESIQILHFIRPKRSIKDVNILAKQQAMDAIATKYALKNLRNWDR